MSRAIPGDRRRDRSCRLTIWCGQVTSMSTSCGSTRMRTNSPASESHLVNLTVALAQLTLNRTVEPQFCRVCRLLARLHVAANSCRCEDSGYSGDEHHRFP